MKKNRKTNAQKRAAKAKRITLKINRRSAPWHDELRPDVADALRTIWHSIGDIHPNVLSLEQFEFIHSKNREQDAEFRFWGFVCARIEQYRAENPDVNEGELRERWFQIGSEFDKLSPYIIIENEDGTRTQCIRSGFDAPIQSDVVAAMRLSSDWLLAHGIRNHCEGGIIDLPVLRADAEFLDALKKADLIVGEDINGKGSSIFYGQEIVEKPIDEGQEVNLATVQFDGATDDLEKLFVLVEFVNGSCDYGRMA